MTSAKDNSTIAAAAPIDASSTPAPIIRTTSNTHEKTAATPAQSDYSKTGPSAGAVTSGPAEASTPAPVTDKPIVTTSNTHEATAPATSPATDLSGGTGPPSAVDKATDKESIPSSSSAPHTREGTAVTSSSSASSPTKHKRGPSFMNKVRGEMKVITGKLSGNDARVEEGRALKSGIPKSATSPTYTA